MAARSKGSSGSDAITLLRSDHKAVQKLFKDFEKLKDSDGSDKGELVKTICNELKIHTQIEEEIFYPAVRDAIEDDDLMDEAEVEHAGAKQTISELESMQPSDDLYDAKVTVLGEYVNHHIKEEQDSMFPKVKRAKMDLKALGEQLLARKQEIKSEMGLPDEEESPAVSSRRAPPASERGKRSARASR